MNSVYTINAVINIIASLIMTVMSIRAYKYGLLPGYITSLFIASGVGWIVLYVLVLTGVDIGLESIALGRIFIRPLITLTLGAITATFVYSTRTFK